MHWASRRWRALNLTAGHRRGEEEWWHDDGLRWRRCCSGRRTLWWLPTARGRDGDHEAMLNGWKQWLRTGAHRALVAAARGQELVRILPPPPTTTTKSSQCAMGGGSPAMGCLNGGLGSNTTRWRHFSWLALAQTEWWGEGMLVAASNRARARLTGGYFSGDLVAQAEQSSGIM
jgi:hypothetical protein